MLIQTHTIKELIDNHWNLQLTVDLLLHRMQLTPGRCLYSDDFSEEQQS